MADVHSKEIRSYNISQVKGKNTKPEMLVRKFLHANGFRYKLHDKSLPGKPDIVLPKYKNGNLCKTKNEEVVEYAMSRNMSPTLISQYTIALPDKNLLEAKLHEPFELYSPATKE